MRPNRVKALNSQLSEVKNVCTFCENNNIITANE